MPSYLGNFPNTQTSGEFPKYIVILEISKILKIYKPQIFNGIWKISGIPQMPGNLEKSQIPGNLGNSTIAWGILQISNFF